MSIGVRTDMGSAAAVRYEDAEPKRVVLIVEDEVIIRSIAAEYLRESDFMVLEAANAAEAMTILSSNSIEVDLVFSDVMMPGNMNGFDLARWIHEHHADLPVLLTSGAGAVVNSPDAFSREPFMRKPYLPEELEQRVRTMLRI